jgi:hypothetical protein
MAGNRLKDSSPYQGSKLHNGQVTTGVLRVMMTKTSFFVIILI